VALAFFRTAQLTLITEFGFFFFVGSSTVGEAIDTSKANTSIASLLPLLQEEEVEYSEEQHGV